MVKSLLLPLVCAIALMLPGPGKAGGPRVAAAALDGSGSRAKPHIYRSRAARVRGYYAARRIGGYSYAPEDVVNTYGLSRNLFGATNSYRDQFTDRQTVAGPFDHGFFFDSGLAPHGGDSPYLH